MTPRIAIVSHDAAGNALGRALVLAELLDPIGPVHVIGFGSEIWSPAVGVREVTLLSTPRSTFKLASAARDLTRALRDETLLIASKTRLLSYGLTAAVRGDRPLILDIDDLEHAFVRRRFGWIRQLIEPDREPVTRLLERVRNPAGAITVASRALQRRFGGTWLPHVRDRSDYAERARSEGPELRMELGLDRQLVVGFIGTPRPHKGLRTAASAIASISQDATLLLAGATDADPEVAMLRDLSAGRIKAIGFVSLARVPAILGACDVVVIPQETSIESNYQSPAKLFDAMAAGRAVVASDVGDIREVLGEAGAIVPPGDAASLRAAILQFAVPEVRAARQAAAADRYQSLFGLARWRATMADVVHDALRTQKGRRGS